MPLGRNGSKRLINSRFKRIFAALLVFCCLFNVFFQLVLVACPTLGANKVSSHQASNRARQARKQGSWFLVNYNIYS